MRKQRNQSGVKCTRTWQIVWYTTHTCRRPVLDVTSNVNDGILLTIRRWTKCTALPHTHAMWRRRYWVHWTRRQITDLHAYDESTTWSHTQSHRCCNTHTHSRFLFNRPTYLQIAKVRLSPRQNRLELLQQVLNRTDALPVTQPTAQTHCKDITDATKCKVLSNHKDNRAALTYVSSTLSQTLTC